MCVCVCLCLKYTKLVSMWIALSSVHGSACVKLHAHLSAYMYLCVCAYFWANHLHYKCVSLQ